MNRKRNDGRKLVLNTETLRQLDPKDLTGVVGAGGGKDGGAETGARATTRCR